MFLAAILLFCVALGHWVRNRERNADAVERLRSGGAVFLADYTDPIGPDFLWRWMGIDVYARSKGPVTDWICRNLCNQGPVVVQLYGEHFDEGIISALEDLHSLKAIGLYDTSVKGKSLTRLRSIRGLLCIGFNQPDDQESVAALATLGNLEELWLAGSVSEETAQYLRDHLPGVRVQKVRMDSSE